MFTLAPTNCLDANLIAEPWLRSNKALLMLAKVDDVL